MHASRSSSATARSSIARATTIPPTHNAAIARACAAREELALAEPTRPFTLRSSNATIAVNTFSNAALAARPLRETSVGSATIGHEFSTFSKCCRER
jgi:hypothetical protein